MFFHSHFIFRLLLLLFYFIFGNSIPDFYGFLMCKCSYSFYLGAGLSLCFLRYPKPPLLAGLTLSPSHVRHICNSTPKCVL